MLFYIISLTIVYILYYLRFIGVDFVCLVKPVQRRVVSEEVLARTEIPGRWGKSEIIYLTLHCHHQNDTCIKMGSDEAHFNVSLIVRDKVTRQCPQTTTFKEKGEPKRNRTEDLLLPSLTPYRQAKPAHSLLSWLFATFISCLPQWGTADAEIKVPSVENQS